VVSWRPKTNIATLAAKFLEAVHTGDFGTAQVQELLLPDVALEMVSSRVPPALRLFKARVDTIETHGSDAEAYFTLVRPWNRASAQPANLSAAFQGAANQRGAIHFVHVNQQWRVRRLTFPLGKEGIGPVIEFETKQEARERLAAEAATRRSREFDALQPVDLQQFAASWRVDLEVQNRPVREVLRPLLPSGFERLIGDQSPGWNQPVSLQLRGASRWQAIEGVCREVGMYPDYEGPPGFALHSGTRFWPTCFAGPFLVETVGVKEYVPHATGTLTLRCRIPELPPAASLWLEAAQWPRTSPLISALSAGTSPPGNSPSLVRFRALQVVGPEGQDLLDNEDLADVQPTRVLSSAGLWQSSLYSQDIPLKNLFAPLRKIARVRGQVHLTLPTRMGVLRFSPLVPGATQQGEGARLTLRPAPSGTVQSPVILEFDAEGLNERLVTWIAFDRDNTAFESGHLLVPPSGRVLIQLPQGPAAMAFKAVVAQEELAYDFEMRDLPLIQRQPVQLEPALFPGQEAPVSIKIVSFTPAVGPPSQGTPSAALRIPGRIDYQLVNHCQKAVVKVRLKLTYLDASGRLLKETSSTLRRRAVSYDGRLDVLLPAKESPLAERGFSQPPLLMDPGLPADTKRISATVIHVGFADGTTWTH
jgi:hypothetical protein